MSTEARSRPQYGEYASKSEQASAIERSGAEPSTARLNPVAPQPTAKLPTRTTSNVVDRLVTIFLLSFGLVYVIGGAGSFLALGALMERMFGQLGIGDYTPTSLTSVIGIIIVVSQAIIWLIAAGWSYMRISRRRLSWWIPVVGGTLNFLVSVILLGILLASDPVFVSSLVSS